MEISHNDMAIFEFEICTFFFQFLDSLNLGHFRDCYMCPILPSDSPRLCSPLSTATAVDLAMLSEALFNVSVP